MADEFDAFLSDALAPIERAPDRSFVAKVQASIVLDERLRAERRAVLRAFALELLGLAAVAAALAWIARSPAVAAFAAESPGIAVLLLILLFSFLVLLFGVRTGSGDGVWTPVRGFSNA